MQSMDLKTSYMLMGSKHRSLAPASLLSARLVYGTVYWTSLLGCLIDISSISCHTLNSTSFTLAKFSKWHYQSPSCSGKKSKSHPRLLFSLYSSCPVNYPFRLHPKSDNFFLASLPLPSWSQLPSPLTCRTKIVCQWISVSPICALTVSSPNNIKNALYKNK